ncbi:MAG: ATP-binding cassette domain-containing protein [Thioalkalispiraceae bacterium]|jgi:ABC-type multidrug transport system ATPase subunit
MSELRLQDLKVLHVGPVNLTIKASEIVGLSGESGIGKSLLLRAIADLIPHQGQVFLDDVSSLQFRAPEWRKQVGLLPAESQWWRDLVGNHFSSRNAELLNSLGLTEKVFDWQVSRCSTGERQRLAIARLLANQPKCLLLDEPTGNLDSENTRRVERLVKQLSEEQAMPVIWVSHSEEQIRRIADRYYVVRDGGVYEK